MKQTVINNKCRGTSAQQIKNGSIKHDKSDQTGSEFIARRLLCDENLSRRIVGPKRKRADYIKNSV